jgi:threonine dehydratase
MKESQDKIKSALSEVSGILLKCNEKATVLKACNDFAAQEEGFTTIEKQDISNLYAGMSTIIYEIVESISDAQNLIGKAERGIDGLNEPIKKVAA